MAQPIRKNIAKSVPQKRKHIERTKASKIRYVRERMKGKQEYGTSKLEERFARDFLDKLGINYTYQYKAESIGRYFDFRICPDLRGPIIEVQGSYWHGDPRIYEEKDLDRTQKRDIKIDELKRKWCRTNGIKLIYVWEKDINESPSSVMKYLKEELKPYLDGTIENKKKRH
jgi:very-short-patch-repair endonuclease